MKKIWLAALLLACAAALLYGHARLGAPSDPGGADTPQYGAARDDAALGAPPPVMEETGPDSAPLDAAPAENASGPEAADGAAQDVRGEVRRGKVARGDTMDKILENASGSAARHYVNAARKVFSPRSFRAGQPYVVVTDPETGRVARFEYEIDDNRRLVVEGLDEPSARLEDIEYTVVLDTAEGAVESSLFQAVADVGETPQLALKLVQLFGSEINFIKDLRAGDSFRVLMEKRYRDGRYSDYGRILAATFTNRGRTWEAFLFADRNGREQYYNRRGENLHKTLLQAPLAVTRVTSSFSHKRFHPILRRPKPHLGVDYGAPTGTPVKAVGDGVVTARGWAGGYGNQIVIRHNSSLESLYAHLSGYARGLVKGRRVRQGDVIGYVGSTGLSTGPHLDFRLRQDGRFINPAKAINPRGEPVPAKARKSFENSVRASLDYLDGRRNLSDYKEDSVLPALPATGGDVSPDTDSGKKRKVKKARARSGVRKAGKTSGRSGPKNAKRNGRNKNKRRG